MKNRLRKMLSLVLAAVIAMSAISVNTLAATIMNIANGSNQKLYVDWYSYSYNFNGRLNTSTYGQIIKLNVGNSTGQVAYCIQSSKNAWTSDYTAEEYYNFGLGNNTAEITKRQAHIKHALIYGYQGTTKYGYNADTERIATQIVIWNICDGWFNNSYESTAVGIFTEGMSSSMATNDRTLDDEFIRDILDNNCKIVVSKHIKHIDKSEAQDRVKDNIYAHQGKIQARLEKNHKKGLNFVPYHWTERERELEDLQERLSDTNCELFKIGVFISLSASTKEELEELTEAIRSKGKKHQVVIDCLVRRQEKALDSVLPFGINHFDNANGNNVNTYVLSDAAGILIPFSARSYFSDTGLCYGMNKHTNAIIVLDRAEEMNANGFILGTSGSGKSMYCKSEIIDTVIRYPKSEKIIIDPDGEYYPIIKQFGGDTLKLSADSETKINIFDTDINISENGTSAVAMKSELIMSIIETARGLPLSAADKSIIDSCVKEVYADYVLNNGNPEFTPTFVDFYNALINKKLPEADQIALDIELYVNGSFNTFSGRTNIHTDNRLLSIDISDMGEQLRPVGLQVILEYIWQRVRDNRNKGIQTWVWVDEFSVMFNDGNGKETVRSADFFQKVFKRIRKYGGIPTGITQNITEVLDSGQAKVMLSNSEFVVVLQQKKTDLDKLIELFNLSPSQSSYLQTGEKGTGLIVSGRKIIPFDRRIPKDSAIYKLCQTDFRREI